MRALLWLAPEDALPFRFIDGQGALSNPQKLQPLVDDARSTGNRTLGSVQWTDRNSAEALLALPLSRRGAIVGVLLAATSLKEQLALERSILWTGVVVAATGIGLGLLLGWWTTERVTRPVEKLAAGARAVAQGDWSAQVSVSSNDEFGSLARSFNHMTRQLLEHRDRAIQAERVAAWRELARRLAHELKNPLFPLQITIENLQRARSGPEFDEVFRESTQTLLEELANLKTIIGRFGDFAKMPPPEFAEVDLNEIARSVAKLYEPRLHMEGRAPITCKLDIRDQPLLVEADGEQLRRALGNLMLNAMDAMPQGGILRVAAELSPHLTVRTAEVARLSVSDSGEGLTPEECSRLFTPYYTTKLHGTGLGLAIVQSVVSDHHGRIQVHSQPGEGTTFVIDLPQKQERQGT
jgi:nitrogen fixation/metabolism regulation signal transduction histidine kinase